MLLLAQIVYILRINGQNQPVLRTFVSFDLNFPNGVWRAETPFGQRQLIFSRLDWRSRYPSQALILRPSAKIFEEFQNDL